MDLSTLIGAGAGLLLLAWAVARGGSLTDFLDLTALAITVGGTAAATLIHYPLARLKAAGRALRTVVRSREAEPADLVRTLVEYAERARREGVLALEQDAETAPDPFLRKALQLLVDGSDPEDIRAVMENELAGIENRQKQSAALFETMAQLAPSFGLVGTLVSLVQVFRRMESPSGLGSAMAAALLATFYGVVLANLIFVPVAGKLKARLADEVQRDELLLEGVLAIQAGDTPSLLLQKLNSYLPPGQRASRPDAYGAEE